MNVNLDFVISVCSIVASSGLILITRRFEGNSGFFPMLVLACILAGSVLLLFRSRKKEAQAKITVNFRLVGLVLVSFSYVFAMPKAGYLLSTFAFFMATLFICGYRSSLKGLVISAGLSYGIYLLFVKILSVPLPSLGQWF